MSAQARYWLVAGLFSCILVVIVWLVAGWELAFVTALSLVAFVLVGLACAKLLDWIERGKG